MQPTEPRSSLNDSLPVWGAPDVQRVVISPSNALDGALPPASGVGETVAVQLVRAKGSMASASVPSAPLASVAASDTAASGAPASPPHASGSTTPPGT